MNRTGDDYNFYAPLECHLCLPHTKTKEIYKHCREVEVKEKRVMIGLLVFLGVMTVAVVLLIYLGGR